MSRRATGAESRVRLAGLLVAAVALAPVLTSCGDNRPPKPRCQAGYQADWDGDDHEWECERKGSHSSHSTGHRTRTRARH
ncbi:hypothetical protein FF36_01733 [Frankia torreyi]|uniref:Lipoprotein n=1 Tax=Frankia torreyi TaxID=1856 RepID=A0A0D8BJ55_9ACTN|nr:MULTISPECIES: hypothetical protein [Frankia]KJE24044.1 hypothetical protein FF36_01733 [Frankia torreyi]KQC38707.1 hypothetical protein UK82_07810 [Frankia sp. ACN1ag]KQM07315.1 hypothetical protein FF86_10036 [Frankia sp. CpI1-P]